MTHKQSAGRKARSFRKAWAAFAALGLIASLFVLVDTTAAKDESINYTFNFENGETISGTASDKVHFLANAGGSSVASPTGMDVHLSCSDKFPGGWGEKDGPQQGVDTAWQIDSYRIEKMKDGKVDKSCGTATIEPPAPVEPPVPPSIDLEKLVNGMDADDPQNRPVFEVGDVVTITYVVTNNGSIRLTDVQVTDDDLGNITCPKTTLAAGETMTCSEVQETITNPGPIDMSATATGTASLGTPPAPPTNAKYGYSFVFVNGTTISGSADNNVVTVNNAGGSSVTNPTGMDLHISCSDEFPGGWGEKDGPQQGVDSAWQIASYTIVKTKNGEIDKTCADTFVNVSQDVSDSDPIYIEAVVPAAPSIDVEKSVNGVDADNPTGPAVAKDSTVRFGYKVTNTGTTTLTNVQVNDPEFGAISCPKTTLAPGEMMVCDDETLVATTPGQQSGNATVTGQGAGQTVTDADPVNYLVEVSDTLLIDIEKSVNGVDADNPTGPTVPEDSTVRFGYKVTNTGTVYLYNVAVTDPEFGSISCPKGFLAPGEMMVCDDETLVAATPGQQTGEASVTGQNAGRFVDDVDPVNYLVEPGTPTVVPPSSCLVTDNGNGTITITWPAVDGAVKYQVRRNGFWKVRTADTSWTYNRTDGVYTVESVFPGEQKSARVTCTTDTPADPTIDIEKSVNGVDADNPTGPTVPEDSTVRFGYKVTNTGAVTLTNVAVTDPEFGSINCPKATLAPGEMMTCDDETLVATTPGQQSGNASVSGQGAGQTVTDADPVNYLVEPGTPTVVPPSSCLVTNNGDGTVTVTWPPVDGAKSYQVRRNGHWKVRTTETWFNYSKTDGTYTVESVFPGEQKSATTTCDATDSNT